MDSAVVLSSKVPPRAAGQALLDYLAGRFRYRSADEWAQSIADGAVTLNGARVEGSAVIARGDTVSFPREAPEPVVEAPIDILHTEADFGVVVKPAGLPCHADGAFVRHTLVHRLCELMGRDAVRLVHRLDRETSGVMVVAWGRAAARHLGSQFAASTVTKEYEAIVHGAPEEDEFVVNVPIGRKLDSEISLRRVAGKAEGASPARTAFLVVARGTDRSHVLARPATGRAHQIRVHLEHAGHPIVGDKLYGRSDAEYLEWVAHVKSGGHPAWGDRLGAPRQLLHASRLAFEHPGTGARMEFSAPPPQDFRAGAP